MIKIDNIVIIDIVKSKIFIYSIEDRIEIE